MVSSNLNLLEFMQRRCVEAKGTYKQVRNSGTIRSNLRRVHGLSGSHSGVVIEMVLFILTLWQARPSISMLTTQKQVASPQL